MNLVAKLDKDILEIRQPLSSQAKGDPFFYYANTLKVAETCLSDDSPKMVHL